MFKTLTFIMLLALACSAYGAFEVTPAEAPVEIADLWTDSSAGWPDDIAGLTKELYKARLAQLAILIADESGGESGLLLKDGVSANPDVKYRWREGKWGDIPAVSVYQASMPVNAHFDGIDPGRIVGAVALLVEAPSPSDKNKTAKPGVYMLYMLDRPTLATTGETELALVSLEVGDKAGSEDEGKVFFKEAMRIPGKVAKLSFTRPPKKTEEVTLSFPKAKEVSADKPANRASASLRWDKQILRFDLEPAVEDLDKPDKKEPPAQ